ncbi:tetratricopeptide repeat protein [Amycolatopsis sp. NPDC059657]|uniref:tetratricopeptide repeat protein n=1 Tax=Amycolatopsis sp. NPDC059657 TaxID=3346899 RepID=UPI00366CB444
MALHEEFTAEVRRLLRARGMSIPILAKRTAYSASYVTKILRGERALTPVVVHELDCALDAEGVLERIAAELEAAAQVRPAQLPPANEFVGRDRYLQQITAAATTSATGGATGVVVLEGAPGVGKTSTAVHWAATAAGRYPGGCLFAELLTSVGPADPGDVLDGFLRALGASPDSTGADIAVRTALYRTLLEDRPALVVLDNATSSEQVELLLPPAGSLMLVTSRSHRSGLLRRHGATALPLEPFTSDEALALLAAVAGAARVAADATAAREIVDSCGRLPLAVRIAGDYLLIHPHATPRDLAQQLSHAERSLDVLAAPDDTVSVRAVIDMSYRELDADSARVFRAAGTFPGIQISAPAAAALSGMDLDTTAASLGVLVKAHLIEPVGPGVFRLHTLLRLYAAERAQQEETVPDLRAAQDRLLRWYCLSASNANHVMLEHWIDAELPADDITPAVFTLDEEDDAVRWCAAETSNALAVTRAAYADGTPLAWMLPALFLPYFFLTKSWNAWLSTATTGLAAAEDLGDDFAVARSRISLGCVLSELGRTDEALSHLHEAARTQAEINDPGLAWAAFTLGITYLRAGRHDEALDWLVRAYDLVRVTDFQHGIAFVSAHLATAYDLAGQTGKALDSARVAVDLAKQLTRPRLESLARHRLGLIHLHHEQHAEALDQLDQALRLRREHGERWREGETLLAQGKALSALGLAREALDAFEAASKIFDNVHDPNFIDVRTQLAHAALNVDRGTRTA